MLTLLLNFDIRHRFQRLQCRLPQGSLEREEG